MVLFLKISLSWKNNTGVATELFLLGKEVICFRWLYLWRKIFLSQFSGAVSELKKKKKDTNFNLDNQLMPRV